MKIISKFFIVALFGSSLLAGCSATTGGANSGYGNSSYGSYDYANSGYSHQGQGSNY